MIKIGVQGASGSFSEQAGHQFAKRQKIDNYTIEYLISSEQVLASVDNQTVDFGVFAMENAQGGVVIESVKALAHYRCEILDMYRIMISQNLMVLPGTKEGEITEVHSHPQALRQCKNYLADHFWSCPLVEEDDTAESARRLKEGLLSKTSAVIGNKSCADIYELEILTPDIQDLKNNLTLFLGVKNLVD